MIDFEISTITYEWKDNGTTIFRDEKTLGYIITNTGNCPIVINNFLLRPASFIKTFEPGYRDTTTYRILMQNPLNSQCAEYNATLSVLIYSLKK
jgi:hypothetical protein